MENYNIIEDLNNNLDKAGHLKPFTDTLSVEDGFVNRISDYVMDRVSSVKDSFNVKFDKLASIIESNNAIDINLSRHNGIKSGKELRGINFRTVDDRMSPVVLGMDVSLVEYNRVMNNVSDKLDSTVIASLQELSVAISSVLSDESYRKSFKPKDLNLRTTREYQYKIMGDVSKLIDPNSKVDRLKVGTLVPNLASISPLASDTAKLANMLKKNKMTEVNNMVKEISEKVDILHSYINGNDNKFTVSKATISGLADALDVNAELVTTYSTAYVLINQQVGMVNSLIEVVKK